VFKPDDELQGFSVDVVDMNDCAGPHHSHPNGEICRGMRCLTITRRAGWFTRRAASTRRQSPTATRWSCIYYPRAV
jgi:hypothetical protein